MVKKNKEVPAEELEQSSALKNDEKDGERERAGDLAIAQIEKSYGEGSIGTLNKYNDLHPIKHVSSGSLALDIILGKGGYPFGRIVEIFGPEASGKTTLLIELIVAAQKLNLKVAFVDMEQGFNAEYAKALGVNLETLDFAQPDNGEQALSIIETLAKSGAYDVIILDSIAACASLLQQEKDMTENPQMGLLARMMSRFLGSNMPVFNKNQCLFVATNQIREKVGVMFGNPETTTGGRAMKFYASQRIDIRVKDKLQDANGEVIGQKVQAKTVKNKMNSPYKTVNFDIVFGKGIDKSKDLIELAHQVGVVEKTGTWFSFGEQKLGQGIPGVTTFFEQNPETFKVIRQRVVDLVGSNWGPEGK